MSSKLVEALVSTIAFVTDVNLAESSVPAAVVFCHPGYGAGVKFSNSLSGPSESPDEHVDSGDREHCCGMASLAPGGERSFRFRPGTGYPEYGLNALSR